MLNIRATLAGRDTPLKVHSENDARRVVAETFQKNIPWQTRAVESQKGLGAAGPVLRLLSAPLGGISSSVGAMNDTHTQLHGVCFGTAEQMAKLSAASRNKTPPETLTLPLMHFELSRWLQAQSDDGG